MRRIILLLVLLFSIKAFGQPTANFTASVTQGCAPLLVQFTNTSTGTNGTTTYSWNFNNGTGGSVLPSPSTTFITPGTYTIVLTVTGPGGSNTKTVTNMITVHPSPTVSFSANDTDGCPPHAVQFTNTSNANAPGTVTYLWNFGDGTNSSLQSPSHTYGLPGSYNTSLQITNSFGCVASLTKPGNITVYQPPVATFVATTPTACQAPGTTTFNPTVTGTAPFTYAWNFGDATTSTLSNPVKTYATAGSYTVILVVTDGRGCKDTAVMPAYINIGTLNASFTTNPASVCEDAPVTFSNTSGPGPTSAYWQFGNSTTGTGQNPTIAYATPGTYTVTLIVTQGTCQDTVQQTFVVQPKPTIDFTASTQDPCPVPATIAFTNTTTGASTYTWLFGDGGTSNGVNPSHTYTVYPDNYNNPTGNMAVWDTVTLIATSSFGCTDTLRKPQYIRLRNLVAGIDVSPAFAGCIPFTTTFTMSGLIWTQPLSPSSPAPYPFPMTSWVWNFGDGSPTSTTLNPTHTYTTAGTFYATLTYTTANGCTKTDTTVIRTGTIPVPSFTVAPSPVCTNTPVNFTSTATGVNPQTVYTWDFGDGGAGTGIFTQHPYTTSGTYTVIHAVDNNGCIRRDTLVNIVTVNPPSAHFTTDWDCDTPTLVRFINSSQNPTSYTWYFGDGNTNSTTYSPTHIYPALGTYQVKLVTFNSTFGCKDSFIVNIDLIDLPPAFTTADTTICAGQIATFTGIYPPGSVNQLIWHTGIGPLTGPTSTWYADTSLPVYTELYPDTGRYTVRLAMEDSHGCWDTLVKSQHMLVARPSVGFSATPRLGCAPLPVTLLDTSHHVSGAFGVTRAWTVTPTLPLSTTVNTAATSIIFSQPGLYGIKLKVTDNIGCIDSLVRLNYIDVRHPSAAFSVNDTSACIGQNLSFSSNSTGTGPLTLSWSFGDGGTATGVAPTHAYSATGTYTVRLIVTDTVGCKDTLIKTAYISVTKPDAAFTVSDTMAICPPLTANVASTSTGAVSYNWAFGNGGVSVNPTATNLYTASGIYTIRLIVSDLQGCTDTAERTVRVLGYAGLLSYSPLAGCEPLTVSFVANIQNVPSIIWDFSDGVTQTATGQTTTHTYLTPGAYVPKLLLSDGSMCQASSLGLDTIKVDGVLPGFIIGTACAGSPVTLTDTSKSFFSGIANAQWFFPSGPSANGPTTTRTFPAAGTYPITLVSTNTTGCKDTVVRSIAINPLPSVSAGPDTSICIGSTATLQASGAVSYVWSPAATLNNPAVANPAASPTAPTTYTVVGTDANGCKASDSMRILLQIKTTATAAAGDSACFGTPLQLRASGAETYQWMPSDGLDNPTSATPMATPAQTTTYLVISRESTCIPDSDRVTVVVWPKPDVNAGGDVQIFSGKSTRLVASGPSINTFFWAPPDGLSCTDCADPDAAPLRTTEYIVYASNNYGCSDTDAVIVTVLCDQSQLFIPNSFSPNGDGQNDRFFPHGTGLDRVTSFRVYNRWGEVVYERTSFPPNSDTDGWDGTHKGSDLPPDTFVYMVEAECLNGERIWVKGDVTLVR